MEYTIKGLLPIGTKPSEVVGKDLINEDFKVVGKILSARIINEGSQSAQNAERNH